MMRLQQRKIQMFLQSPPKSRQGAGPLPPLQDSVLGPTARADSDRAATGQRV